MHGEVPVSTQLEVVSHHPHPGKSLQSSQSPATPEHQIEHDLAAGVEHDSAQAPS